MLFPAILYVRDSELILLRYYEGYTMSVCGVMNPDGSTMTGVISHS